MCRMTHVVAKESMMKIKHLKKLLENYDDDAEFVIAISDHAETLTFDEFEQDNEYEGQALVLTVSLDDNCYFEYDKREPNEFEIYQGASIMVDYQAQNNQDIIDFFEEQSMFEGWATLNTINEEEGTFTIKEMPHDVLSVEYLIAMNLSTNQHEFYQKD